MLLFAGRLDDALLTGQRGGAAGAGLGEPDAMAEALFCVGTALAVSDTPRALEHLQPRP